MEKTAMQELLGWLRKSFPMDLDTPNKIEDKIIDLIERERQQIEEAYHIGFSHNTGTEGMIYCPQEYYDQTYNQTPATGSGG